MLSASGWPVTSGGAGFDGEPAISPLIGAKASILANASRTRSSAKSQRKSRIGPDSAISSTSSRLRAAPSQSPKLR
jgi:hypothetical protein